MMLDVGDYKRKGRRVGREKGWDGGRKEKGEGGEKKRKSHLQMPQETMMLDVGD